MNYYSVCDAFSVLLLWPYYGLRNRTMKLIQTLDKMKSNDLCMSSQKACWERRGLSISAVSFRQVSVRPWALPTGCLPDRLLIHRVLTPIISLDREF